MSRWRVVQRGTGPAVVLYLVGAQVDADLRAALPGRAIVATDESGLTTSLLEVSAAIALAGLAFEPPVLVGYSAGCQGVRGLLFGGLATAGVVVIDGTHSSIPPAPAHLAMWRGLADAARAGGGLFVATCTQMGYVERIPIGQPGRATSTRHVLEQALGVALPAGTVLHEGRLHVESHASADIDHDAHVRDQREHLPRLLRDVVRPWLEGTAAPDLPRLQVAVDDAPSDVAPGTPVGTLETAARLDHEHDYTTRPRLGLRALDVARDMLARRIHETPGPGSDPQVSAFLASCRRGGSPVAGILDLSGAALGLRDDATAWCAAFASWCTAVADPGADPAEVAHGYRASVAELVADAKARGRFRGPSERPELGWLAIFARAGGDPLRGGTGHVGRVSWLGDATYQTIDGNHGDAVAEVMRRLDAEDLRGWVAC